MNYFKTYLIADKIRAKRKASWQCLRREPRIAPDETNGALTCQATFNQEYLAQFVNWEGSVCWACRLIATATDKTTEAGHHYVIDATGAEE
jgi:hypothetical protein